jgi:hypothetical protein
MNGVGYGITPFMGASGILARSSGGGGVPFVNEYSMTFDGIADYITMGNPASLQITGSLTLSAWVKTTNNSQIQTIIGKDGVSTGTRSYLLNLATTGEARFFVFKSGSNTSVFSTTQINDGLWHHVLCVNDGADLKMYIDGTLENTTVGGGGTMLNGTSYFAIGRREANTPSNYNFLDGNIDSVAVWNSDQSSNINSIYSPSGALNLSSLNPVSWWRMGDGDSFSTNWTLIDNGSGGNDATSVSMPEEARLPISPSSYSQNSFVFDGIDDFVTMGNPINLRLTADLSISCWMKFTDSGATRYALSMGDQYGLYTSGGTIRGFARIGGAFTALSSVGTFNDGNWHHVMYVKNATNMLLYIDGSLNASNTSGGINTSSTLDQRIGSRYTNANYYDGSIDEVYIWDNDQSVNISTIYGNGVPTDLSSLNPLGHWRFGETDIFSTTWTFVDQGSGGNDGTSSTLPEGAKTGDQPYVI